MLSILLSVVVALGIAAVIMVAFIAECATYLDPPRRVVPDPVAARVHDCPRRQPVTAGDAVMRIQYEAAVAIRRLDTAAAQAQADMERASRHP
ncbi:hypothetical protein IM877_02370 [Rhodococcus sp. GG48]|nr:hypothetical protein [Rhodococcus sp. GG48]